MEELVHDPIHAFVPQDGGAMIAVHVNKYIFTVP